MKCIAYLRVSTGKQGESGLGIEAQRARIEAWARERGATIVREYTEAESGKRADRPELTAAMRECHVYGATLVVATMSRLTRSLPFLTTLRNSGLKIELADMPTVNGASGNFMVNMMATVAQYEAELISERTKAALAALKGQPGRQQPGNPNGAEVLKAANYGNGAGTRAAKAKANARAIQLASKIRELREQGFRHLEDIAAELNRLEVPTPRGGKWHKSSVRNLLDRLTTLGEL